MRIVLLASTRMLISLTLFLITTFCCTAQDASLFHYNVKNGLVDNFVTCIVQDDRGFIWIGTAEGLSSFDGKTFKNYLAGQNRNALSSNSIYHLLSLPGDRLAISVNGELQIMETASGKFYDIKRFGERKLRLIQKLDAHHNLVSADSCFITDENFNVIKTLIPSQQTLEHPEAYRLQQNLILIAAQTRFFLYDTRSEIFRELPYGRDLRGKPVDFLCYDSVRRAIYFDSFGYGLYRFSIDGELLKHWTILQVDVVKQTDRNHFLIGRKIESNGGLLELDVRTDSVRSMDIQKESFDVTTIVLDKDGSQWIGTSQGITRRKPWKAFLKNWKIFDGSQKRDRPPGEIVKGADHGIYFTFKQKPELYRYNPSRDDWDLVVADLGVNVWSTGIFRDEIMFTGNSRYCVAYHPVSGKYYPPEFQLQKYFTKSDVIMFAHQHTNGDQWFSGNNWGGLLRIIAKDKSVHHYNSFSGQGRSFSYFATCAEDSKGDLWFGVVRRLELVHWNKNTDQLHEIKLDTIPGSKGSRGVNVILPDAKGHIWVGFDGTGIADYDPVRNKIVQYTFEDGLASGHILSLVFDKSGRLWIGTPKGLSYLNMNENHISTLTSADGFTDDRFAESSLYYDSTKNTIWIGSVTAITRFNPDSLVNAQNWTIHPIIDEIIINGKTNLPYNATAQLSYDQNNLLFRFTAIEFDGRVIQYNYRLSNHDKDWVNSLNSTVASYANLEAGTYTFNVRARLKGDKQWTEVTTPFHFVVLNVWYKTWWFSVVVTLISVVVIFMLARIYYLGKIHQQLEKQQAIETERTRIATDMHDDFGATLSIIKFISEKIKLRPVENEELNKDLTKISNFSDQMSEKMNEIVWALNERYDTLDDLISFSRAYAADYCAHHDLELSFVSNTVSNIKVNAELRRNVFLVLKEALHNVAKHAKAQKVSIEFEHQRNLYITLSDDGKGIGKDTIRPFANGLKNMKMRIESINGNLEILSGVGTTLKMNIPLNQDK